MTDPKKLIGIQGGRGSFNETALRSYLAGKNRPDWEIKYLHTTPEVLQHLHRGAIHFGQFAIYNTVGGLYEESLSVLGDYTFKIEDRYTIRIAHALMIRKDATLENIDMILSHIEVFNQCRKSLGSRYANLKQQIGTNNLADPASVAEALALGRLPDTVAVLSNSLLAEIHDLRIVEKELQDDPNSRSTFLLVSPKGRDVDGADR